MTGIAAWAAKSSTDMGALLLPLDSLLCPKEFVLKPLVGEPRFCEVMWRKGTKMGVSTFDGSGKIARLRWRTFGRCTFVSAILQSPARARACVSPARVSTVSKAYIEAHQRSV
jgi:hypothetical protein